jgi:hypothetical protein
MAHRSFPLTTTTYPAWARYIPIIDDGGIPSDYQVTSVVAKRTQGSYTSTDTSEYHKRLRQGYLIPDQYYSRWDFTDDQLVGSYYGHYKWLSNREYKRYLDVGFGLTSAIPTASTQVETARSRAMAEISDTDVTIALQEALADLLPSLDVLTELAEAHKTVKMFCDARRRFVSLVKEALRGGMHTVHAASSAWLEWRYGWRILGYSIEDFVKYQNHPWETRAFIKGSSSLRGGKTAESVEETASTTYGHNPYYRDYTQVTNHTTELQWHCRVRAKVTGESLNLVASPAVTLWELVPFSFVADWFLTTGDALKAWTAMAKLHQKTCSLGFKYKETTRIKLGEKLPGTGAYAVDGDIQPPSRILESTIKGRMQKVAVASFPRWRVNLSTPKVLDALALGEGSLNRSLRDIRRLRT